MKRVAALYLPEWPIERLWRAEPNLAPPEGAAAWAQSAPAAMQGRDSGQAAPDPAGGQLQVQDAPHPAGHAGGMADLQLPSDDDAGFARGRYLAPREVGGPRVDGWRPGARWAAELNSSPGRGGGPRPQGVVEGVGHKRIARGPPPPSRYARHLPARGEDFLVTTHRVGSRIEIAAASPAARAVGARPGLTLTSARAVNPGLIARDADPDGDRADLLRLAVGLARRWSPTVAFDGENGLAIDLSGVAHLHGGEEAMARRLIRLLARLGFTAQVAIADTLGAAHALSRHGPLCLCPPDGQAAMLANLPPAALRLTPEQLDLLRTLGIATIGQLAAMPRAPLARRFGGRLLDRLDAALGRIAEPLDPIVPPEPIAVVERFAEPIATPEAIAHWLGILVPRLAGELASAGIGARRIELIADRVDHLAQRIRIGLARPSRDPAHILKLLLRRIESVEPGYGIDAMTLHIRAADPLGPQAMIERLDEDAAPDLAPLVDTLATLRAATWRATPVESEVPERSVGRRAVLDPPAGGRARTRIDDVGQLDLREPLHPWHPRWPRPVRLLHRPERLDHVLAELPDQPPRRFSWRGATHKVVRADGPERIGGEWWRRGGERHAVRDYFRVEDEAGARFWLYRRGDGLRPESGNLAWFVHGWFG